ncbi:hypothetical protein KSS87_004108 [Heliosperma pusillum]|nr:hypothetical protein KSS87_004108 [Heliosperma pusillum]
MESIPIGRRTRLQQAIKAKQLSEEKKRQWFNARSKWRNRANKDVNLGVVSNESNENDNCGEEGIKVEYDEIKSELNAVGTNSIKDNISVGEDLSLGGADNDHNNSYEESKVVHDANVGDSDDSLQIIDEKWNPDYCYESHSSVTGSDSDSETITFCKGAEDEVRSSGKTVALSYQQVNGFGSSSNGKDRKEISDANVDGENFNSNGSILKRKDRHKFPRNSNIGVFRRFDGLFLPKEPDNNAQQCDYVGRRTRSRLKSKFSLKKIGNGTFSRPVTVDDGSSSWSDGDKDDISESRNNHVPKKTTSCENASSRKRGRPRKINRPEVSAERKDDKGGENVVKRKRGRPRKKRNVEKEIGLRTNEVENIMLNTIMENGNGRLEAFESSVSEGYLPLKFSFPVHNSLPEKSNDEEEIERLFNDLDFSLPACDAGCSVSLPDKEDDNVLFYESVAAQTKLCHQGKHNLILEDEIGISTTIHLGELENNNRLCNLYDGLGLFTGSHVRQSLSFKLSASGINVEAC